ncbi:MAG: class I SAM-dependent methyltransferase [Rhodospirillum sp.]|nr:class I SAM-dependent methyltransferase [Rhodospirillum sp.]MCF8491869.1 class I SAM-dependent methyltransferase [Rhodospirillum sp.]MCF8502511.1 class I SAM-dependent methyltransferase [Rhodospirillum sp.]
MWTDVVDLREFYASRLGRAARRLTRAALREQWPNVSGARVLGLGYASPYLRPFVAEAERVMAAMPAPMGAARWPVLEPALTTLVDEFDLPFPDRSVDRLLLVHALEFTEHARTLLRECWRVLADGGTMIVVVPNRAGAWARLERSPFANGLPYSEGQLSRLLKDNMFAPLDTATALFLPPTRSRLLLGSANAVERLGNRWFSGFGGVVISECAKQIALPLLREAPRHRVYGALSKPSRITGPSPATRKG